MVILSYIYFFTNYKSAHLLISPIKRESKREPFEKNDTVLWHNTVYLYSSTPFEDA